MSIKSKKPPAVPQLPAQPSAAEVMDVIDEIAGSQTVTVTLPNGRKQRVTKRLPRTPQEDAILRQGDELMARAVDNIQRLYQYDPASVANYQPFIDTFSQINEERSNDLAQIGDFGDIAEKVKNFKQISRELTNREFDMQSRMSEELLAKRGLQNSTVSAEQRTAMARERALVGQQASVNAEQYGDQLIKNQLSREKEAYDLREAGRTGRLTEAQTAYQLEQQQISDEERNRQNLIRENEAQFNIGRNIRGDENERSRLALSYGQGAQTAAQNENVVQNNRYANDLTRIRSQHQMEMDRFNDTPASFGRRLVDVGLGQVSQAAGGATRAAMSAMGVPSVGEPTSQLQSNSNRGSR